MRSVSEVSEAFDAMDNNKKKAIYAIIGRLLEIADIYPQLFSTFSQDEKDVMCALAYLTLLNKKEEAGGEYVTRNIRKQRRNNRDS